MWDGGGDEEGRSSSSSSSHPWCRRLMPHFSASYGLGLLFIGAVAMIWAASSVVVQYLYATPTNDFHSPFLVTYIGVSLFALWLPYHAMYEACRRQQPPPPRHHWFPTDDTAIPFQSWTFAHSPDSLEEEDHGDESENNQDRRTNHMATSRISLTQLHESSRDDIPHRPGSTATEPTTDFAERSRHPDVNGTKTNQDEIIIRKSAHSAIDEVRYHDAWSLANPHPDSRDPPVDYQQVEREVIHRACDHPASLPSVPFWTHADHFRVACYIAPVWFLANWTYNASLAYTSITSSTVLSSCGSLFTFLFAVMTRDERFTTLKLTGVLLGMLGSLITTLHDQQDAPSSDGSGSPWVNTADAPAAHPWAVYGDILGFVSAIGYGGYAVQIRLLCPHDESRYSMQLVLGYIGLLNGVLLSPIALYVLFGSPPGSSAGASTSISWLVLGILIVKGLFDNVLSDYLWLRAVMLTNATVATVGLGLTIPLAFVSDIWLVQSSEGSHVLTIGTIGGALTVLLGFVLVNIGNDEPSASISQYDGLTSDGPDGSIVEGSENSIDRRSPTVNGSSSPLPHTFYTDNVVGQGNHRTGGSIQVI